MREKVKNIGIKGINPPSKICNDPKCPWHGYIKVRGKLFIGTITKIYKKTAKIEIPYVKYVPKYERYMREISVIHSYLPECLDVKVGDKVIVGETRPISKTKASVVLGKI